MFKNIIWQSEKSQSMYTICRNMFYHEISNLVMHNGIKVSNLLLWKQFYDDTQTFVS